MRALVLAAGLLLAAAVEVRAQDIQPLSPQVKAAVVRLKANDAAPLEQLAAAGDAGAQYVLGSAYFVGGGGLPEDKARACELWKAAANTRGDAAHVYAECVEHGHDGSRPDIVRARVLYERAAALGYVKSKCALGNLLMRGQGGPADIPRGIALCREAAEAGDRDAQTDLADVYVVGELTPKDVVEAHRWYEKAAAQDQANAAFILGQIYWNGDGVAKDNARAAELWRVAYDGGRKDAARMLGDEALVRSMRAGGANLDMAAVDEAIDWYERALAEDPASRDRVTKPLGLLKRIKAGAR